MSKRELSIKIKYSHNYLDNQSYIVSYEVFLNSEDIKDFLIADLVVSCSGNLLNFKSKFTVFGEGERLPSSVFDLPLDCCLEDEILKFYEDEENYENTLEVYHTNADDSEPF